MSLGCLAIIEMAGAVRVRWPDMTRPVGSLASVVLVTERTVAWTMVGEEALLSSVDSVITEMFGGEGLVDAQDLDWSLAYVGG